MIYNPASGKRRNVRDLINKTAEKHSLTLKWYETQCLHDAMEFVKVFEIDACYALIVSGGDGTLHEAINGLLRRPDRKRVPICIVPNGTGNDLAHTFGIDSTNGIETAMKFLMAGHVVRIDVIKLLLDYESEEEIE